MKLEQTISWLYFWNLYGTGAKLYLIGWICCIEPISRVAMPVGKQSTEEGSSWEYGSAW